uniref:Uncharacterized protein n=1 Tax=Peronospora matthiolae TaxID=2874970 RepID=A0AAV1TSD6_9STRA
MEKRLEITGMLNGSKGAEDTVKMGFLQEIMVVDTRASALGVAKLVI